MNIKNMRVGTVLLGSFFYVGLLLVGTTLPYKVALAEQTDAQKQAREAELQKELAKVEAEIARNTSLLKSKQGETASIARDIDILTYQISQAKLKIKQKQIEIERLGGDIYKRQETITTLSSQIDREKESLAELLRKTKDLDNVSLTELVLNNTNLSDFFVDLDAFNFIQGSVHSSFREMRTTQVVATSEKITLEKRRDAEQDAKKVIEQEKKKIETAEGEKQRLLALSKSEENSYKQIIKEREAQRAAIRSALFKLRDTQGISFGEAVDIALELEKQTGVRAAFALAILTQESNIGQNVGTCNRAGDPPEKSWREIMPGPEDKAAGRSGRDDQTIFLRITAALGLDPNTTPLSCSLGYGWGGAMGPAQFIPSTWASYEARVSAITGNNPPSPWRPMDAFAASNIFLRDLGAAGGGYSNERKAALRYYAGGNWADPRNAFYGDSVMKIATGLQAQINILQAK